MLTCWPTARSAAGTPTTQLVLTHNDSSRRKKFMINFILTAFYPLIKEIILLLQDKSGKGHCAVPLVKRLVSSDIITVDTVSLRLRMFASSGTTLI